LEPLVCPGGTDARYVRQQGIPAIGFSPMNFTERTLHAHNEFLNSTTFLKGITIYCKILLTLGNLPA